MRAVVCRVHRASVVADGAAAGRIERGLLVFLGVMRGDTDAQAQWIIDKLQQLRVFPDEHGKLNRSVRDVGGSILLIPNFTLAGDARRGTRPSFSDAAPPDIAMPLFQRVVDGCAAAAGVFGAHMDIDAQCDGPITLILDSTAPPHGSDSPRQSRSIPMTRSPCPAPRYTDTMFTGLVQSCGVVASITPNPFGARLLIDPRGWTHQPAPGDSIAVNGCCLTFAPQPVDPPGGLAFDVIQQTLAKTSLGSLAPGSRVNLESCLTPSTPIGGHFVLGHIDSAAIVHQVHAAADQHRLTIHVDDSLIRWIIPAGSIAVDGVSLTVAAVDPARRLFEVALIPTTMQKTNLADRRPGDRVNLEGDVLVKSAVHYLRHFGATDVPGWLDQLAQ
jgi:riboflavin synthase alpha subunit/D-tyrosyl-tRNA(Tyr) deacylase